MQAGNVREGMRAALLPWVVCLSASLFFFYEFVQGNMFASIADEVMRDFHIKADKMAYLSSSYYILNVLFLFIAGAILDAYSIKRTVIFAMLLCVLSTFGLAYAHTFEVALFFRLITGLGSAFCFLGPIRLATDWFSPRQMALVTGVIVTIAMIGGMTAQYPLTKLVNLWGWRQAVIAIAWAGVFMLLVMAVCIKEKPKASIRHKTISLYTSLQKAYANMHTLKAALYTSLMNMAIAVFGAMMGSLYLIEKLLITKEEAALVNTLLFLGAIVGGPLIGFFSDKCRLRILPMKIGAVVSLLVALAIIYMPVSLGCMKILFFLLGFFTSAQIISYALVAESTPSSITATAVSVVSVLTQGGYIVYQNVFSYLLLYHGDAMMKNGVPVYSAEDYQFAAMVLPLGLLIALWSLRGLKETHCHSERESK